MKLIVLPFPLNASVDTTTIRGVANVSPANTFRYNLDKREHVESILGDVSEYIMDRSEIVESPPTP